MEFRIMTYNIYGARLADGKNLAYEGIWKEGL